MKRSIGLFPVAMMMLFLFFSCGGSETSQSSTERYVKATEILPASGNEVTIYNGIVKERRGVTLSFKVGGTVEKILVKEGQYVKKGEMLAIIEKRDYKVQLQAAEAQYTQTKGEYERYLELYNRKKLPANTLDKLKAGYLMAKSQFEAAKNALYDSDLKAPFSGYVNSKFIEDFQTIAAGMPIMELLDLSDLEVVLSIPESKINEMKDVSKILCDIKNASQFNIPAKLRSLSKKSGVDRMYEAKFVLESDSVGSAINPGMIAKVKIYKGSADEGELLVPVESVFSQNNQDFIWLVVNQEVVKQEVSEIQIVGNGLVRIKSPAKVGEMVITAGVNSLVDRQKVKILPKKSETNIGGLL